MRLIKVYILNMCDFLYMLQLNKSVKNNNTVLSAVLIQSTKISGGGGTFNSYLYALFLDALKLKRLRRDDF